jgi:hypothetical protein
VDEPLLPGDGGQRPVAVRLFRELRLDEQVGDDDVGTGAGEHERVGAAEPTRAAGHERDAPGQVDLDRHQRTLVEPRTAHFGQLAKGLQSFGRKISFAITRR